MARYGNPKFNFNISDYDDDDNNNNLLFLGKYKWMLILINEPYLLIIFVVDHLAKIMNVPCKIQPTGNVLVFSRQLMLCS